MNIPNLEDAAGFQEEVYAAFLRTVEHSRHKLQRVALRITRNHEEAEDIVQESVLRALLNLHRFRGDSRMDTWLYSIVTNSALSRLRRRDWRCNVPLDDEPTYRQFCVQDFGNNSWTNPEQSCVRRELRQILFLEIDQLSPLYRSVIQVCDIEGHSYSEAAEILKLRVTTMKARLYRGRCLLRQRVRLHMAAGIRSPAIDTTSPVNRNESQSL